MRSLLALLLLSTLLLGCARARRDETGQIVAAGPLTSTNLELGDCFQDWEEDATPEADRISRLEAVPCDEPHDNQVFHIGAYTTAASPDWPGEDHLTSYAASVCLGAFEPFVGREHATSRLGYGYIRPTQESWEAENERRIVCFLFDSGGAPLTGSMRGSGQ
jgi:hypothetical protein